MARGFLPQVWLVLDDPVLKPLLQKHGPAPFQPHPFEPQPLYPTLLRSIVGQQLSAKAAETIWQRLVARFDLEPEVVYQVQREALRAVGLSEAKARYVRAVSRFALEGGLEGLEALSDEAVVQRLVRVEGVGVWTAQMFLMFVLGRPDVWPVQDLGLRRGAERLYPGQALEALGERFRPYRSHAAWYLWRALE